MFASLIASIAGPVLSIIDKAVTDKDLAQQLKHEIGMTIESNAADIQKAAAGIVQAEVQGESAVQRNWRPHLMYLIMGLLVFNGVVVPMLWEIFDVRLPVLEAYNAIPAELWNILMVGLGGYIGGRSLEKIAGTIAVPFAQIAGAKK